MRIGELAKRTGLTRDTIRFYEKHGLIESRASTAQSNNYRDYAEEAAERLVMISEARSIGFTVAELQTLFRHLEETDGFDANPFLDAKIEEVRSIIERSQRLLTLLETTQKALARAPYPDD